MFRAPVRPLGGAYFRELSRAKSESVLASGTLAGAILQGDRIIHRAIVKYD